LIFSSREYLVNTAGNVNKLTPAYNRDRFNSDSEVFRDAISFRTEV
jgi:hypothetical protein